MSTLDGTFTDLGPRDPLVRGQAAFQQESREAHLSRAGQLLSLGTYLRGDAAQIDALRVDAEELIVPFVFPIRAMNMPFGHVLDASIDRAIFDALRNGPDQVAQGRITKRAGSPLKMALWRSAAATRSPVAAVALLRVSATEGNGSGDLERAAAAAALFGLGSEPEGELLAEYLDSDDHLVAGIARAALADTLGDSSTPESDRVADPQPESLPNLHRDGTSVAVHGTWSRLGEPDAEWWRPHSSLSRLIREQSTPYLYAADDNFRWTGGYSHYDRENAGEDLIAWGRARNIGYFDTIFAHSHGGNVAMSGLQSRATCSLLVLLHVPVLRRSIEEWHTLTKTFSRVLDFRTRMDLVVLADGFRTGSTSRLPHIFPHRRIQRHWREADAWFSHSFFIEESSWSQYALADEVVYERRHAEYSKNADVRLIPALEF